MSGIELIIVNNAVTGAINIPSVSSKVANIPNNVTSINSNAFNSVTSIMTGVIFGNSPTLNNINSYAFYNCNKLLNITIPSSVTSIGESAFENCSNLTNITINSTVLTSINNRTFYWCTLLKTINIPNTVTSIGISAFRNCDSLTSVSLKRTYTQGVTNLASDSFKDSLNISVESLRQMCFDGYVKNTLTTAGFKQSTIDSAYGGILITIVNNAVTGATNISSVSSKVAVIPNNVTSINSNAFNSVNSIMTGVIFGNSPTLNRINDSAFYNCNKLLNITIPSLVTSIGENAFENCSNITNITINSTVLTSINYGTFYGCTLLNTINIPNTVTLISTSAFYNCTKLLNITIPSSVTSIGESAFENCSDLKNITINSTVLTSINNRTFFGCTDLKNINILNTVTSIGIGAFYDCNSLTSIIIPSSVTSIGESAFRTCNSLTSVSLNRTYTQNVTNLAPDSFKDSLNISVESLRQMCFDGYVKGTLTTAGFKQSTIDSAYGGILITIVNNAVTGATNISSVSSKVAVIPNNVTSINSNAFNSVASIMTGVIFGNSSTLNKINNSAFYNCTKLLNITIPSSVTSIGENAFENCSNITNITINSTVLTSINNRTFYGCTLLKTINIPDAVTLISTSAFYNCTKLLNIIIPSLVTSIGESAFENCSNITNITINSTVLTSINNRTFYGCTLLKTINIPDAVTLIGESAFYNCTKLLNITIPPSVTSIGESAFENCSNLTNISIKIELTSINNRTFYGCTDLQNINIPDTVTSIGIGAFYDCNSLTSIKIPSLVTSIGESAFRSCNSLISVSLNRTYTQDVTNLASDSFKDSLNINVESLRQMCFDGYVKNTLTTAGFKQSTIDSAYGGILITIVNNAVTGATNISSVSSKVAVIPNNVTSINSNAFNSVTSIMTGVIFGNSSTLNRINDSAFINCYKLKSITIPSSVTSIGQNAFQNCTGLTSVSLQRRYTIDVTLSNNSFFNTPNVSKDSLLQIMNNGYITEILLSAGFNQSTIEDINNNYNPDLFDMYKIDSFQYRLVVPDYYSTPHFGVSFTRPTDSSYNIRFSANNLKYKLYDLSGNEVLSSTITGSTMIQYFITDNNINTSVSRTPTVYMQQINAIKITYDSSNIDTHFNYKLRTPTFTTSDTTSSYNISYNNPQSIIETQILSPQLNYYLVADSQKVVSQTIQRTDINGNPVYGLSNTNKDYFISKISDSGATGAICTGALIPTSNDISISGNINGFFMSRENIGITSELNVNNSTIDNDNNGLGIGGSYNSEYWSGGYILIPGSMQNFSGSSQNYNNSGTEVKYRTIGYKLDSIVRKYKKLNLNFNYKEVGGVNSSGTKKIEQYGVSSPSVTLVGRVSGGGTSVVQTETSTNIDSPTLPFAFFYYMVPYSFVNMFKYFYEEENGDFGPKLKLTNNNDEISAKIEVDATENGIVLYIPRLRSMFSAFNQTNPPSRHHMNTVQITKSGDKQVLIALSPYDSDDNFDNWNGIGSYTKDTNLYGGTTLYDEDSFGASNMYYDGNKVGQTVEMKYTTVYIRLIKERVTTEYTGQAGSSSRFDRTIARIHINP